MLTLTACDSVPSPPLQYSPPVIVLWPDVQPQSYDELTSGLSSTEGITSTAIQLGRSLKGEPVFAWGLIGVAARYSDICIRLETLLHQPDAIPALKALLRASDVTTAGRTCAMLGLRYADYSFFLKEKASLSSSSLTVETQNGCTIWHEPLSKILNDIDSGRISLTPEALPHHV